MSDKSDRYFRGIEEPQRKSKQRVIHSDREAPMVLRGAEKEAAESNALYRRYKRHRTREYKEALAGPHGGLLRELRNTLQQMAVDEPDTLLKVVDTFCALQPPPPKEILELVLHLVSDAIVELRERHGLPPFDDALPGEPDTVFQICRDKLSKE